MRFLRSKKSIIINILLGLYLLSHGAISHTAATLNESTGTLFIPSVDVDRGAGAYSVTLQLAGNARAAQNWG